MIKNITTAEYDALVQDGSKPVLLEFGADW